MGLEHESIDPDKARPSQMMTMRRTLIFGEVNLLEARTICTPAKQMKTAAAMIWISWRRTKPKKRKLMMLWIFWAIGDKSISTIYAI